MSSTTVHCEHCGKEYDDTQKDTIRLHAKACLQNPDRITWQCETCDRIFPHRSGMVKHNCNLSRKHKSAEHGTTRVTVPLETPRAPKVHKTSTNIEGAPLLAPPKLLREVLTSGNNVDDESLGGARGGGKRFNRWLTMTICASISWRGMRDNQPLLNHWAMKMAPLDRDRAAAIGPGQSGKDLPARLIPKATKAKKKVGPVKE
jgi:hypothetical protein